MFAEQAIGYFLRALAIEEETRSFSGLAIIQQNIGYAKQI